MKRETDPSYDKLLKRNRELRTRYESPLIKWYQATMTKKQRYEMGLMDMEEYTQWQAELAAKAEAEARAEAEAKAKAEAKTASSDDDEYAYHTFWEGDEGDRSNISNASYAEFLAQNKIDVSNRNAINFDDIMNES